MAGDPAVLCRHDQRAGRITLNRPRTLNALDLSMIEQIEAALLEWQHTPSLELVAIVAVPGRAFCAGGDVRNVRQWALEQRTDLLENFFTREYALNRLIARYPKPVVALIDGLWMGGGVGLSVHGRARVVTERAVFAMPEVQIGLFPDVGASYVLPRLPGAYGMFLALTGTRVGASDAIHLGLATHFVPSDAIAELSRAIAIDGASALDAFAEPAPTARDLPPQSEVDAIFGAASVDTITAALAASSSDWAVSAREAMRTASPSALRWTFDLMQAGARRSFEECQAAELALVLCVTAFPDFAEGVRALVIDKDRQPRWAPCAVESPAP